MRSIKFRTWNTRAKRYLSDSHTIACLVTSQNEGIATLALRGDILEQYIGLKDKNGTDIYEGDILEGEWIERDKPKKSILPVLFISGSFYPFSQPTGSLSGTLYETNIEAKKFQVIGNINQNPDLIKEDSANG